MKNKKLMLVIIITICVLLVILLIVQSALHDSNMKKGNVINSGINNDNTIYEDENSIDISNNIINEPIAKTDKELFKEALLDEKWVKQNLYIKESSLGNSISSDKKQEVKFLKINKDDTDSKFLVLVQVKCEELSSEQCYVLNCENNSIKINKLNQTATHTAHTTYHFNIRNKVIYTTTYYFGEISYDIFSWESGNVEKIYSIKSNEQYLSESNEKIYKYFVNAEERTEVEFNNIKNQYIGEALRRQDFKLVNQTNINEAF